MRANSLFGVFLPVVGAEEDAQKSGFAQHHLQTGPGTRARTVQGGAKGSSWSEAADVSKCRHLPIGDANVTMRICYFSV